MTFRKNPSVIYRDFGDFGYITDNRNFAYKKNSHNTSIIGDKILSNIGSIFFSKLSLSPKNITALVEEISQQFPSIDLEIIKKDAIEFYTNLESDGFVFSNIKTNKKDENSKSHQTNNISTTTSDFFKQFFNGNPYLTNVHLDIISKCNERCSHCYIPSNKKTTFMDKELFYKILSECDDLKVIHFTISGGEPLLHPNIIEFLNNIIEHNYSLNLLSNLLLFNSTILNIIKKSPLIGIQTSLYSMDPYIHDKITGVSGSFEKTRDAILKIKETNIPIQISCPIFKINKDSYYSVIEWGERNDIKIGDDLNIIDCYDHSHENLEYRLKLSEVKDYIYKRSTKNNDYLRNIKLKALEKKQVSYNDFVCSVCSSSICIGDNGDIYPCAGWRGHIVANINESPLRNIWLYNKEIQYLRNLKMDKFPKCLKCPNQNYCTMCMIRNANESQIGNYLEVNDYYCSVIKIYKELAEESNF